MSGEAYYFCPCCNEKIKIVLTEKGVLKLLKYEVDKDA